jgi:hypothetical protein
MPAWRGLANLRAARRLRGPPVTGPARERGLLGALERAWERVRPRRRALGSRLGAARGGAPTAKRRLGPHGEHHHRKAHLPDKVDGPEAHRTGAAAWRRSSPVDCEVVQLRRPATRTKVALEGLYMTCVGLVRRGHTGMATGLSRKGNSPKGENPRRRDLGAAVLR